MGSTDRVCERDVLAAHWVRSFRAVLVKRFRFLLTLYSLLVLSYTNAEIVGRNCRFLQSPTGEVRQGEKRKYTDGAAAYHLRSHLVLGKESQASLINYAKGGRPFINLVTM